MSGDKYELKPDERRTIELGSAIKVIYKEDLDLALECAENLFRYAGACLGHMVPAHHADSPEIEAQLISTLEETLDNMIKAARHNFKVAVKAQLGGGEYRGPVRDERRKAASDLTQELTGKPFHDVDPKPQDPFSKRRDK